MLKVMKNRLAAPLSRECPDPAQGRPSQTKMHCFKVVVSAVLALALITLTACASENASTAVSEEAIQSESSNASSSTSKIQDEPLELTPTQRRALQALISKPNTSPELALQVQMILAVAGGMDNAEVARRFGKGTDKTDLDELLKQLQD